MLLGEVSNFSSFEILNLCKFYNLILYSMNQIICAHICHLFGVFLNCEPFQVAEIIIVQSVGTRRKHLPHPKEGGRRWGSKASNSIVSAKIASSTCQTFMCFSRFTPIWNPDSIDNKLGASAITRCWAPNLKAQPQKIWPPNLRTILFDEIGWKTSKHLQFVPKTWKLVEHQAAVATHTSYLSRAPWALPV